MNATCGLVISKAVVGLFPVPLCLAPLSEVQLVPYGSCRNNNNKKTEAINASNLSLYITSP